MTHRLAPLLIVLLLGSCNKPVGSDGFHFEGGEWSLDTVTKTRVKYDTLEALQAAHRKATGLKESNVQAWAQLWPKSARCTVHILNPAKVWAPHDVGHEDEHCFSGNFHPSQKEVT